MKINYSEDNRSAFFGGYKFRKDAKTGYYLSNKKTDAGHRERLHCYVWRYYNGDIPKGSHIHHADENKENNDISNLRCVSSFDHEQYHLTKRWKENHDDLCKKIRENAVPKAMEWHHSDAGRAWHSEQARNTMKGLREKQYICNCCGKEFSSKALRPSKYCSNYCKTKHRIKSGVDNEPRNCAVCGRVFYANKYAPKKCCSPECSYKLCRDTKHQKTRERAGL